MSNELRCSNCDRLCRAGEKYCSYCHEPIVMVPLSDGTLDDTAGILGEFYRQ